jgi:hypothetical protein
VAFGYAGTDQAALRVGQPAPHGDHQPPNSARFAPFHIDAAIYAFD